MEEPDFSESQLQIWSDINIRDYLKSRYDIDALPFVFSTRKEKNTSWDSGYIFPWLKKGQIQNRGCNFFVQYKLSKKYISDGASGWENWNVPFFRFNLGYRKNRNWDFHQRDHLIKLRKQGFVVIYITNHILNYGDLHHLATNIRLIDTLPALDVTNSLSNHTYVSFTEDSDYFHLHSETESMKKHFFSHFGEMQEKTDIREDISFLVKFLMSYEEAIGLVDIDLSNISLDFGENDLRIFEAFFRVRYYLKTYLNVSWVRTFEPNEKE